MVFHTCGKPVQNPRLVWGKGAGKKRIFLCATRKRKTEKPPCHICGKLVRFPHVFLRFALFHKEKPVEKCRMFPVFPLFSRFCAVRHARRQAVSGFPHSSPVEIHRFYTGNPPKREANFPCATREYRSFPHFPLLLLLLLRYLIIYRSFFRFAEKERREEARKSRLPCSREQPPLLLKKMH